VVEILIVEYYHETNMTLGLGVNLHFNYTLLKRSVHRNRLVYQMELKASHELF